MDELQTRLQHLWYPICCVLFKCIIELIYIASRNQMEDGEFLEQRIINLLLHLLHTNPESRPWKLEGRRQKIDKNWHPSWLGARENFDIWILWKATKIKFWVHFLTINQRFTCPPGPLGFGPASHIINVDCFSSFPSISLDLYFIVKESAQIQLIKLIIWRIVK